jgi:hypothetical protein
VVKKGDWAFDVVSQIACSVPSRVEIRSIMDDFFNDYGEQVQRAVDELPFGGV